MANRDRGELENAAKLIVGVLGSVVIGGATLLINANKSHKDIDTKDIDEEDTIVEKKSKRK